MRRNILIEKMLTAIVLIVIAAVWMPASLLAEDNPQPPSTLFAGGLNLVNVTYSESTWDPITQQFTGVSGVGEIILFPLDAAKIDGDMGGDFIPLSFEQITIDDSGIGPGQVIQGDVIFPPQPQPWEVELEGFVFTLLTLTLNEYGAHGSGHLQLPDNFFAASTAGPAELDLNQLSFHPNGGFYAVSYQDPFGPWALAETGIIIEGTGFTADFTEGWKWDGWPGPESPDLPWRGLILMDGQTVASATPPLANTGYLQAPYDFGYSTIDQTGLTSELTLSQAFSFQTLLPLGHEIFLESGDMVIQANQVVEGEFLDGTIQFPQEAVRSNDGALSASYGQLEVQSNLDLFGPLIFRDNIRWGEFTNGPDTARYAALGSDEDWIIGFYFLKARPFAKAYLPLALGDTFTEPNLNLAAFDMMTQADMQGAYFNPNHIAINSEDIVGDNFLTLGDTRPGSWGHIGARGVNGTLKILLDNDDIDLGDYPLEDPFDTLFDGSTSNERLILFRFVDSALYESDAKGTVTLPKPADTVLDFENLRFTSTAQIAAADITIPGPVELGYWGVELVGEAGATEVGVMSVREGLIMLTSAGIYEKEHFERPFWLIWGELEPDGAFGNLSFDFSGYQEFDKFPYTTEAIALSEYIPMSRGYLEVGGTIHYPYFGAKYLHVIDEDFDIEIEPYNGRIITLSEAAHGPFKPSDLDVEGNWGNGTANMAFTLSYDDGDQSGFQGVGQIDHFGFHNNLNASLNFESGGGCLAIQETHTRDFDLGPISYFSSARNITGCACIEDNIIKQFSLTGELVTEGNQGVRLRSAGYGSVEQTWTPATFHVNVTGNMFLSLLVGTDLQLTGNANFHLDRDAGSANGHLKAKLSSTAMFSGLEANGEFEWHAGDYQAIQGRVSVDIYSLSLFGYGGSNGVEGGFFAGIHVPKGNAWILSDAEPEFNIAMGALPDHLTGIYGYAEISGSKSWSVLAAAGYRLHVGLGAFVGTDNSSGVPGLPYGLGNMGAEVWGEILGGLISARGWANLQLLLPYPAGFQGKVGLEGCVGWLICDSVELTLGLNSEEGFYID